MTALLQDLRYAARTFRKSPGFALVAAATLALAIGANAAIFAVLDAVVIRPLPYREPGRLVAIWEVMEGRGGELWRVSAASFRTWREENRSFESVAAFGSHGATLTAGPEPEGLKGGWASPDYFRVLGITPALGRFFSAEEALQRAPVIILGNELWKSRFAGDRAIVGRSLLFDGVPQTVIGVMPPGMFPSWPSTTAQLAFDPGRQQYWMPREAGVNGRPSPHSYVLGAIGRLKPGVSIAAAQAELTRIARGLHATDPDSSATAVRVRPLRDEAIGNIRPALLLFGFAVGFVLLIASVNVAGLQLARAEKRRREIAIRSALGGNARRILVQLLTENLALGLAGGALGVLVAVWGLPILLRHLPATIPRLELARIDATTVAFAILLSVATSVVLGILSGAHLTGGDTLASLRGGTATGALPARRTLRALVAVEIGLAVLLVTGAGLLGSSLGSLERLDPGFRPEGALVAEFAAEGSVGRDPVRLSEFHAELLDRVRSLPGVVAAGLAYNHPLEAHWIADARIEEGAAGSNEPTPTAWFRSITEGYFRAAGVSLEEGRDFQSSDDRNHPPVAIVNESFARRFARGTSPVGRILETNAALSWWGKEFPTRFEIVGVVRDVRFLGLQKEPEPAFYLSDRQFPLTNLKVVIRTSGDPRSLVTAVRRVLREASPTQPAGKISTLAELYDRALGQPRVNTRLMVLFGGTGLLLAMLGIYGLLSFIVAGRRREIGIRIALGARSRQVIRVVVGEVSGLAIIGCIAGLVAARALVPLFKSLLFGVSAGDPVAWAAAPAALLGIALLASYLPARRATRIDPMETLKTE
jgi:putative ABC transport system permease protein